MGPVRCIGRRYEPLVPGTPDSASPHPEVDDSLRSRRRCPDCSRSDRRAAAGDGPTPTALEHTLRSGRGFRRRRSPPPRHRSPRRGAPPAPWLRGSAARSRTGPAAPAGARERAVSRRANVRGATRSTAVTTVSASIPCSAVTTATAMAMAMSPSSASRRWRCRHGVHQASPSTRAATRRTLPHRLQGRGLARAQHAEHTQPWPRLACGGSRRPHPAQAGWITRIRRAPPALSSRVNRSRTGTVLVGPSTNTRGCSSRWVPSHRSA